MSRTARCASPAAAAGWPTGATLLEQAENAGLHPEFGCRMGICRTCTSRKIAGSVRHRYTGELSTEPDSEIQICSTVPVGDVSVDR
ncbi:MAG TPA: 2Fe-2S iron-sulfur cluster binding domain-containing protein [Pseudonocardiaceae bacterium]|nr:2Fe-2S iron-sulfur cluster binding domain-containing protein [Pseudonocardiaceae bacterium]